MRTLQVGDFVCKVGENAQENWDLVDQARKGHWFFHLTDFPSPYVVLECDRQEPNAHIKEHCAEICVEHSKQRHNKKVKVDATMCSNVRISRKDDVGECDYKNEGKVDIIVVQGGKKKGETAATDDAGAAQEEPAGGGGGSGGGGGRGKKAAAPKGKASVSSGGFAQGERASVRKSAAGWATVTLESAAVRDALLRRTQEIVVQGGVTVKLQPQVDPKTKEESPHELFASWGRKAEEKSPVSEAELLRCFEELARRTAEAVAKAAPTRVAGADIQVRKAAVGGCAVVAFQDPAVRKAILELGLEVTMDSGVVVKLRPQCDPKTKEEVPNEIFAAWGRKVEEATPVGETELLRCFERLRDRAATPGSSAGAAESAGGAAEAAEEALVPPAEGAEGAE